jgi:hypothetical protein
LDEIKSLNVNFNTLDIEKIGEVQASKFASNLYFIVVTLNIQNEINTTSSLTIIGRLNYIIQFQENKEGEFGKFKIETIMEGKSALAKSKVKIIQEKTLITSSTTDVHEYYKTKGLEQAKRFYELLTSHVEKHNISERERVEFLNLFPNGANLSKIGVSNYLKNLDLSSSYSPEAYLNVMGKLTYSKIELNADILDFESLKETTLPNDLNRTWTGKVNFLQYFSGRRNGFCYCDRTIKTVELIIQEKDGQFFSFLGDITPQINSTTEIDCECD